MLEWARCGLCHWPSTLLGLAILAVLAALHLMGADGIRALAGEVSATGELLAALSGTMGAVPGVVSVGLLLWRGRGGPAA